MHQGVCMIALHCAAVPIWLLLLFIDLWWAGSESEIFRSGWLHLTAIIQIPLRDWVPYTSLCICSSRWSDSFLRYSIHKSWRGTLLSRRSLTRWTFVPCQQVHALYSQVAKSAMPQLAFFYTVSYKKTKPRGGGALFLEMYVTTYDLKPRLHVALNSGWNPR